jgi:short-subunit dehydrogenase
MRLRYNRSAIVNVGSGMSALPSPNIGVYPASKIYLDVFTLALEKENCDKIDVLLLRPLGVTTDLTNSWKGN